MKRVGGVKKILPVYSYLMSQNSNYQLFGQFDDEDDRKLGKAMLAQGNFRASLSPSQGIPLVCLRSTTIEPLVKRDSTLSPVLENITRELTRERRQKTINSSAAKQGFSVLLPGVVARRKECIPKTQATLC